MVGLGIAQLDHPTFDSSMALFVKALNQNPKNHLAALMVLYLEQIASIDHVVSKWKPLPLKIDNLPEEMKSDAQFYFNLLKKKRNIELPQEENPEHWRLKSKID